MKRDEIKPNDIVLHKPTGAKWVVAGVNYDEGNLVPMGNSFSTVAKIADCKLLERRYETEPQNSEAIRHFMEHAPSYVDVKSAVADGWFG